MIRLTRLSGRPFVLNADRILYIEETPDTIITLDTKERVLVKDSAKEVIERVVRYYQTIRTFGSLAQ
jgi:flagellar protein FlbD